MNKQILIISFFMILILITIGGYLFLNTKSNTNDVMMNNKKMDNEEMMKSNENTSESSEMIIKDDNSKYIEYSNNILKTTSGKRVLFFYASWCPTCRPADETFKTNSNQIPDGVKVIRVNYNDPETDQEEKDLAKKYGITYQHTFVQIDEKETEITKWNGGQIDELISNIK